LSKEGSSNSIIDRPTSSSSTKSRIPRTTSASSQQKSNGSNVGRINDPLQLRGPNTASVYSVGFSSDPKQKDPLYKTNRSMTSSRGKDALQSVRRTENGRINGNNTTAAIYKGHSILDSSKVLVR
jgi:hypothetical protein